MIMSRWLEERSLVSVVERRLEQGGLAIGYNGNIRFERYRTICGSPFLLEDISDS